MAQNASFSIDLAYGSRNVLRHVLKFYDIFCEVSEVVSEFIGFDFHKAITGNVVGSRM